MVKRHVQDVSRRGLVTVGVGAAAATLVAFTPPGAVAIIGSIQARCRDVVHVKDHGVTADGVTNDTAALQSAIIEAARRGCDLDFGDGTILVYARLDGTRLANNKLFGGATIKAASGTDFEYLLDISGTTGVTLEGLTFNANKTGRRSAVGRLSCIKMNATVMPRLLQVTCKNTLGLASPTSSSVAIRASDGTQGLSADGLKFINLGNGPNDRPSDGIFIRGDHCIVTNTYGEGVTDHIAVLEGCNYSRLIGTTGKNCTSFVAMSNDQTTDVTGNVIDGVTGTCNYFGSFGAIVGIYTFSTGWIRGCVVTNVSVRGASGAGGGGPAVLCSGNIEGDLSRMNIHPGASTGVMHQAILINITGGGSGLRIRNSVFEVEGGANVVRIQNASNGVLFEDCDFREGAIGIFADGTSSFTEARNRFLGQSGDRIGLGGSATFNRPIP